MDNGQFNEANKSSREKILATVKQNQPSLAALPQLQNFVQTFSDVIEKYKTVLRSIGGNVYEVKDMDAVMTILQEQFTAPGRMISVIPELSAVATFYQQGDDPHLLQDVDVAIIPAHFAVAENGSVWVTEAVMQERVLPFICQHLAAVVDAGNIVDTMHTAYDRIAGSSYGFGTFIAGPSKTADIEQSLVLGAHGPKTMTVFILNKKF